MTRYQSVEEVLRSDNRDSFVQLKEQNGGDIGTIVEYLRRRDGRKWPVVVEHDFFNGLIKPTLETGMPSI